MIFHNISDYKKWRSTVSGSVGFVPTLGGLHRGHLSLVHKSISSCDYTVVSIFLNPKQFNKNDDLGSYPASLDLDLFLLKNLDVSAVFVPKGGELYSDNFSMGIIENQLSKCKEGLARPGFFNGVLTVVAKLFNIIDPSVSFFGEKDPQQLLLIKKLCNELNFNIDIVSCPTVREKNGLAYSTRNKYLSDDERKEAGIIYSSLKEGLNLLMSGERNYDVIYNKIKDTLFLYEKIELDYLSIAHSETLLEYDGVIAGPVLISLAVFIGKARFIDSVSFSVGSSL